MSLIRFDGVARSPSGQLWQGLVDWVRGSLATALGQRDFEDFAPYRGVDVEGGDAEVNSCTYVSGTTGIAATHETDRHGKVKIEANAAANAQAGLARRVWYDLQNSPITVVESRFEQNADANSPQLFVGLCQASNPDDVFDSGAIATGSNQEAIGLLWNADETIDIVAVDDGTKTVLKDNVGVTVERDSGVVKMGLRVEKVNSSTYRVVPSINGVIARAGIVNVAATSLPEDPMRPIIATTVAETTKPSVDVDWLFSADK